MTIVLQESAVTYAFVEEALPLLEEAGIDALVYYVASAELFDLLPAEERRELFPEERAREAMGITGFTLPTMYRWVRSRGLDAPRCTRTARATSSAAARARWCSPRPASTARASSAPSRPTWTRECARLGSRRKHADAVTAPPGAHPARRPRAELPAPDRGITAHGP